MPTKAPSICNRCHYVVVYPETKCPRCSKASNKEYNKTKRNTKVYDEIYNTTRWKELRELVIKRDKGLCQNCFKQNRIEKGVIIDRIKEIADGGDKWSIDNLELMCRAFHNIKTSEEREKRKSI